MQIWKQSLDLHCRYERKTVAETICNVNTQCVYARSVSPIAKNDQPVLQTDNCYYTNLIILMCLFVPSQIS